MPDLKETAGKWIESVIKQAVQEASSGTLINSPELSEKFTKTIQSVLREAYAYGYWLNHLYVRDIEYAYNGGFKYRGRIRLADMPTDEKLREILEQFINFEEYEEWYDVIPQEAIDWLDGYVPSLAGNLSQQVLEKVQEVISTSLISGSTLTERMKALREAGEEMREMSNRRIESIARTEITRADTLGRLSSMKGNEDVIGVEFSAVMDDRTTEICSSRHGLIMRLDDPRLPENTPPLHVNCRSLLISLTVYDYPDGVLTSHEFDEVSAGMQRAEDIAEAAKILGA